MKSIDTLVIGAGQAGLAIGYFLKKENIDFVMLERENRLGDVWRNRYDSLVLFTPRAYSSLPGLKMNGEPFGYPNKDEIADYLEGFANHFDLPVHLNTVVYSLNQIDNGFHVETSVGDYLANKVIIATGPFQKPYIPSIAESIGAFQLHTSVYRNPSQLNEGNVLVIGAGNSGSQIASEIAKQRNVYLSVGQKITFTPTKILGKSIFWWFDKFGLYKAGKDTPIGKLVMKNSNPIFGSELKEDIKNKRVMIKPRTIKIDANKAYFEDDTFESVDNIIWATGFHSDYSWVHIPGFLDKRKMPIHKRGVSVVKGLFLLGLPWQYSRGSALIGGVGTDAEYLLQHIKNN